MFTVNITVLKPSFFISYIWRWRLFSQPLPLFFGMLGALICNTSGNTWKRSFGGKKVIHPLRFRHFVLLTFAPFRVASFWSGIENPQRFAKEFKQTVTQHDNMLHTRRYKSTFILPSYGNSLKKPQSYRFGPFPRNPTELIGRGSFRLSIACNRLITWMKFGRMVIWQRNNIIMLSV